MSNHRQLAPAAYLVAAVLVVFPLFDSGISLSPWNMASAQWRFGAVGLLSNTLMIVALGAFIAVATAVTSKHDQVRRVLGYACWLIAVVLLASIAAFALDAVQARPQIRQDMMLSYQLASLTAEVKLLVGALSFALFGRGCRYEGSAH
ncbi:MAG: hypothetical protein ABI625_10590 [bacterium]